MVKVVTASVWQMCHSVTLHRCDLQSPPDELLVGQFSFSLGLLGLAAQGRSLLFSTWDGCSVHHSSHRLRAATLHSGRAFISLKTNEIMASTEYYLRSPVLLRRHRRFPVHGLYPCLRSNHCFPLNRHILAFSVFEKDL